MLPEYRENLEAICNIIVKTSLRHNGKIEASDGEKLIDVHQVVCNSDCFIATIG